MGLTTKGRDHNADLVIAYNAATSWVDALEIAGKLGSGTRYANELLALLVHADLVEVKEAASGGKVWRTKNSTDDVIAWQAIINGQKETAKPAAPRYAQTNPCTCGCGDATTSRKSLYRPGHDARHAGQVARGEKAMDTLPTQALKDKAQAIINGRKAKLTAAPRVKQEVGTVKIGRHVLGAQRDPQTGVVRYVNKAGTAIEASTRIAKSFTLD